MSKKLRLIGSVALLAFLAWRTDWPQIARTFAGLRVGWWLLAVALYGLAQIVSSLRWHLLARPLGFTHPPGRFLAYYYVGMFFNLVLPTSVGGDVVRAWYLDSGSGRKALAFLSVFTDRASGLLMLIVIAVIAAVCYPFDLPERASWIIYGVGTSAVAGLGLMFLVLGTPRASPRNARGWPACCGWPAQCAMPCSPRGVWSLRQHSSRLSFNPRTS